MPPIFFEKKKAPQEPFSIFSRWFTENLKRSNSHTPEAFCLSTIGLKMQPEGRILLLKGYDKKGFVFYTNGKSQKGMELRARKMGAMTFHWHESGRQVRIVGKVAPVKPSEADRYFATRPRESQIGAWGSLQSAELSSREVLEKRFALYEKKFEGKRVPRPAYWIGFRLNPERFEFWQAMPYRLHDRILFTRKGTRWQRRLLFP